MDDKSVKTKWAVIKTGGGRVTGYIEVFRTTGDKWVTIPDVSRFADTLTEEAANGN
jgi:hypothetical protein